MENTRPANQQISITNLTFNEQQRSRTILYFKKLFIKTAQDKRTVPTQYTFNVYISYTKHS
jgi:hypothetical protein